MTESFVDERNLKVARLKPGEQFIYILDLGEDWTHLCKVGDSPIDPVEFVGLVPNRPLPYFASDMLAGVLIGQRTQGHSTAEALAFENRINQRYIDPFVPAPERALSRT